MPVVSYASRLATSAIVERGKTASFITIWETEEQHCFVRKYMN